MCKEKAGFARGCRKGWGPHGEEETSTRPSWLAKKDKVPSYVLREEEKEGILEPVMPCKGRAQATLLHGGRGGLRQLLADGLKQTRCEEQQRLLEDAGG